MTIVERRMILDTVVKFTYLDAATIYKLVGIGLFPEYHTTDDGVLRYWLEHEVVAWKSLNSRLTGSNLDEARSLLQQAIKLLEGI